MPELPEVESARAVLDAGALRREIVDVDDSDPYECRPHRPGEIRSALLGRRLTAAHRRGKSMWCDTSKSGPSLGIHLGMSGRIVISRPGGSETDGGDYWQRGRAEGDHRFLRFSLTFADGSSMLLLDPRRLGRVRLDPPVETLGPDARGISLPDFRDAVVRGTAPLKARLLDQEAIAGIGNLLADEILWEARVAPARRVNQLQRAEVTRLHDATVDAVEKAIAGGGVHTLPVIPYRSVDATCPRDGARMSRGTVGGRTTYWCSREQRLTHRKAP
jgi:formamidopyrimidine-DNA glycosylase